MNEFVRLVQRMRTAQCRYFRTRSQSALEDSKDLEFQVDNWISEHTQQQTLF